MAENQIEGQWLKVSETGIAEFMAVLGSAAPPEAKLTLEWIEQDKKENRWAQILTLNDVANTFIFTLGEEFEHMSFDGTMAKSTFTIKGNVLTEVQIHNGKTTKVVRTFKGNKMSTTLSIEGSDVVATNEFEKVQ